MKKLRVIALILALATVLCLTAVAADVVDGEKATATIEMAGTEAVFSENGDMITVTVTSESLKAGSQYVILMIKSADGENYTIDADSILYIDQTAATASGNKGTVTFDVYPSSMTDGIILISGAESGLTEIAIIKGKYVLGDVNGVNGIDIGDAMLLLRYVAGLVEEDALVLEAAELNGVTGIDIGDAMLLLRYVAGLVDSL